MSCVDGHAVTTGFSGCDIPNAMVEVLADRYLPMLQNTLGGFLLGGIYFKVHVPQR